VYADGRGVLRDVLTASTNLGFSVVRVETHQLEHDIRGEPAVAVSLQLQGQPTGETLIAALHELSGVLEVTTSDIAHSDE
jgi:hypothetical protein